SPRQRSSARGRVGNGRARSGPHQSNARRGPPGARKKNLLIGFQLLLYHPELPTCNDCQRWLHNADWTLTERPRTGQKRIPRAPGTATPCLSCPRGRETGRPSPELELSARSRLTLARYYEAKAGAPLPDDEILRRNCALLRRVEDQYE